MYPLIHIHIVRYLRYFIHKAKNGKHILLKKQKNRKMEYTFTSSSITNIMLQTNIQETDLKSAY